MNTIPANLDRPILFLEEFIALDDDTGNPNYARQRHFGVASKIPFNTHISRRAITANNDVAYVLAKQGAAQSSDSLAHLTYAELHSIYRTIVVFFFSNTEEEELNTNILTILQPLLEYHFGALRLLNDPEKGLKRALLVWPLRPFGR
ncbi:hypothetical protein TNCV_1260761 [Trichonephila clavipes]|nr:hypothetical protein TNCV_1260761 [Trichonephila clavipes]